MRRNFSDRSFLERLFRLRTLGKKGTLTFIVVISVLLTAACGKTEETLNEKEWLETDTGDGTGEDGKTGTSGNGVGENGSKIEGESGNKDLQNIAAVSASAVNVIEQKDLFTDRDFRGDYDLSDCVEILLSGDSIQCVSKAVSITDNVVTIAEEGVYLLSGTLEEGMITIDAPEKDKVQLVLAGASISNSFNGAIYVKSADKVFLTLAEGTTNKLENGGSYTDLDGNHIDGVIFAKCDITINGQGSLEITAAEGHGIVTKDDLKVTGGSLMVTAPGHGLSGKDSVRIADGTISVIAGKDGIHSEHDTDSEKGYVYIRNGEFTITSEGDGISAGKTLQIDGGNFVVVSGGGSRNRTTARDSNGDIVSTKGIKGGEAVVINGGTFVMDTQDDGFHSNGALMINGGAFQVAAGDDGFHADETITVAGGQIEISESYEGIEGNDVVISGGSIRLAASDDGINAAGGNDQSGFGGFFDRGGFGRGTDSSILISGGIICVNADGDGVDSNGTLTVTGGELYISGPVNSANGALDCESMAQITGGIVVAAGNAGMAMNFGDTSTQGSALITVQNQTGGADITVEDADGNVLITYTAEKAFNSVVVSCPEMVQGGTYTVKTGEYEQSITLENLIYGDGFGGFGGRGGFGMPGDRGDRGGHGMWGAPGEGTDPGMWGAPGEGMDPGMRGAPGEGTDPGMWGNPGEGTDPGMWGAPGEGTDPGMRGNPGEGTDPGMRGNPGEGENPGMRGNSGSREEGNMPEG